ncbi:Beta-1,3-glucosyltransferase [Campylobacter lari]|uniref:CDP-glycerol glycerophosphotransferase family protein n=1 Tax=Campylobacter lari TaxID=201 RepID=UPI000F6E74EF|nr:CDP-glycerol glycerophosphotransferase family protein [Campylobacter lari]VEJ05717.1 Beta-1,3-glucosyltransferase [Campylobacter lari]
MFVFKKVKKMFKNPKLFFKDAIEKRKKYKGFTQYTIISAVYNTEKYLDDYFNSIINQRLDFKRNIFMILVDDGSTDNSANIIKKYQEKYPKNIVYLYKENGGQASARNLGLKYMQENNYKTPWVTFTDPDDFLDRHYFYEIDKFLATHQDDDVKVIATNVLIFNNQTEATNQHPLSYKFNRKINIKFFRDLQNEMQSSTTSLFCFNDIKTLFNEDKNLKSNFEDGLFFYDYILDNSDFKICYLQDSVYFYRKNISSTTSKALLDKNVYLQIGEYIQQLFYKFEKKSFDIKYAQNIALYFFYWQINSLINCPEKIAFMAFSEKRKYFDLLRKIFTYIDNDTIMDFNLAGCWFFHKVGILNCFKKEKPPFQIVYIDSLNLYKKEVVLMCFMETSNIENIEIYIDNNKINFEYKIVQYDFINEVFIYQCRIYLKLQEYRTANFLKIYLNSQVTKISFEGKHYSMLSIDKLYSRLSIPHQVKDVWMFIDRDYEADDNAECMYRYVMHNHPDKKIYFALDSTSIDWKRLEDEGFNLVDFNSDDFKALAKNTYILISSHADNYILKHFENVNFFVFLQHGVIRDDLSRWLNTKKIDLFVTSTENEYHSIVDNCNRYLYTKREVKLTGLPRHDRLYAKKARSQEKTILIMPTWRKTLVKPLNEDTANKQISDDLFISDYYINWMSVLKSQRFRELCVKFDYKIIFCPHINMRVMLPLMDIPHYIEVYQREDNCSLSDLFIKSSMMITDYSSVAFEMAYLEKPVLYFQFDKDEYFNLDNHTSQLGYFDFDKDGFGPVAISEDELIDNIEKFLKDDCEIKGIYKHNIMSTFKFRDGECCKRIYNEIMFLDMQS